MSPWASDNQNTSRPFYNRYAWAYDLMIDGPVLSRCDFIQSMPVQRSVFPGARILDAGCGTGSYSIELAKRGYDVVGLDASLAPVTIAKEKSEKSKVPLTFQVGNILSLSSQPLYNGILCRGVLNDIIDSQNRQRVFDSFSQALNQGGILILDVREWDGSVRKKGNESTFEKVIQVDQGRLIFRAATQVEHETRRLLVEESRIFEQNSGTKTIREYDFVMQCWTQDELQHNLTNAGFDSVSYHGDYDSSTPLGFTDRIIAVASLQR